MFWQDKNEKYKAIWIIENKELEMDCYCDDESKTKIKECVICGKEADQLMNKNERYWDCHKIILNTCGLSEYVCGDCKTLGWYSTAGSGSIRRINPITDEIRYPEFKRGDPF